MRHQWNLTAAFILLTSLGLASLTASELAEKGREIFNKQQRAVVTVHVVLKLSGSGSSRESQQDITGTVIDPSGLTVLALSACDPTEMTRRLNPDYNNIESEVTDVKI